jgi:hypothetical protein
MVNKYKGEMEIDIGTAKKPMVVLLRPEWEWMVKLEAAFGMSLLEFANRSFIRDEEGKAKAVDQTVVNLLNLTRIVWHGMMGADPDCKMTLKEVGNAIMRAGSSRFETPCIKFIYIAATGKYEDEEPAQGNE